MSEHIHSGDEPFKKAYEGCEEEPSGEVWNKINAELDRQDAVYYRRKFVAWKYIACLFILLSGSALAYYTYFYHPDETNSIASGTQDVNEQSEKPSKELSNSTKTYQDKTTPKDQAHFLPNGKTNFSSDTLVSASEGKDRSLFQGDENKSNNVSDDEQTSVSVKKPSFRKTVGSGSKLKSDSNEISENKKYSDFYQPKTNIVTPYAIQKRDGNDKSITDSNATIQMSKDTSPERKGEADIAAQSSSKYSADSDAGKRDNQDNINSQTGASAQQAKTSVKIKPRFSSYWTVTPFASADIMSYELDDDRHRGNGGNEPDDKGDIQGRESHELSYTAGAMASLQYTPKIGFTTGVQYSHINIGINPQILYAGRDNSQNLSYKFITSSGYAFVDTKNGVRLDPGDSAVSDGAEHNLKYLNIPLLVTYRLYSRKKFSIDAGAGLAAHLLLGSKVVAEIDDANGNDEHITIHKLEGMRHQYFSFVANASLQWHINSRFSFTLIPSFKYAITPITKDNVVNTFPYGFGMGAGVTYKF